MTRLPRWGLGCANIGNLSNKISDAQAAELLEAAWDAGCRYFDTAPHYGLGLSEIRLGRFLANKPRGEFVVSTKVGRLLRPAPGGEIRSDDEGFLVHSELRRVWDFSEEGIERSFVESAERLQLSHIDVALLHDPERYSLHEGHQTGLPALRMLKSSGLTSHVGVGSMDVQALFDSARTDLVDVMMVAGRYTLLDQRVVPEVFDACERTGTTLIAASVLNSGLLAGASTSSSTFDYQPPPAEMRARADRLARTCNRYEVPLPAAALQFPLRSPLLSTVVVGAATAEQVVQNVAYLDLEIPEAMWDDLRHQGLIR